MAKELKAVSLLDIMPPNLLEDENVKAAALAIDTELLKVTESIKECLHVARLNELPEAVIDLLAWQWHVDFYKPDLTIEQKKNMVRTSIDVHRHKGTPYAVETVVKAYLKNAVVREWFEFGGDPYTFKIETSGFTASKDSVKELIAAINSVKNTRSHLAGIAISVVGEEDAYSEENLLRCKIGVLNATIGRKTIKLPDVPKCQSIITTGIAYLRAGRQTVKSAMPVKTTNRLYAGNIIMRTGRITIGGIR